MNKVKLGIIGMGNMGYSHLKDIVAEDECEIVISAIADRNDEKLKRSFDYINEYMDGRLEFVLKI